MKDKEPATGNAATADERGRYLVRPGWMGQNTLVNVGLIVLGVYLVSTFVGAGVNDTAGRISVLSLVIAMPLLAFLAMLNQLQSSRRYASYPTYLTVTQSIAQAAAVFGFGAALWHVWPPASFALVVSGLTGLAVYGVYYQRLERDNAESNSQPGAPEATKHANH